MVNIAGEGLLNLDILFCTDGLWAERDFIVLHVRNAGLQFLCSYPKICPSIVVFCIKQGLQRAFYYMDFHRSNYTNSSIQNTASFFFFFMKLLLYMDYPIEFFVPKTRVL